MPRPLRPEFKDALYHAGSRGNEKQEIYLDDGDRSRFLAILAAVVKECCLVCHAYCLMGNHYHLLVETPEANISRAMQQLNGRYSQWFNWRYGRVGHLFQGRFKSSLVQSDEYLLAVSRYIVLNPVRAGLVDAPGEWRWSSYRPTAGLAIPPGFLTVRSVLRAFDSRDAAAAQGRYRRFIADGMKCPEAETFEFSPVVGDEELQSRFQRHASEVARRRPVLRRERFLNRPSLDVLFRPANEMEGRALVMRQAYEEFGYTQTEIARFLGVDPSTVSRTIRRCRKYWVDS